MEKLWKGTGSEFCHAISAHICKLNCINFIISVICKKYAACYSYYLKIHTALKKLEALESARRDMHSYKIKKANFNIQ